MSEKILLLQPMIRLKVCIMHIVLVCICMLKLTPSIVFTLENFNFMISYLLFNMIMISIQMIELMKITFHKFLGSVK